MITVQKEMRRDYSRRTLLLIIGTLFCLIVADGIITEYLVETGLASEGNPVISFLVGQQKFLYVKMLGGLLCGFIIWDMYSRHKRTAILAGISFAAIYTFIVYWNLGILIASIT